MVPKDFSVDKRQWTGFRRGRNAVPIIETVSYAIS